MIEDNTYEENVKDFNRMFNDLDPDHFDRFTYLMAEAVVRKVELANELTKKLGETEQNYGDRLRDVQIWCKERLYRRAQPVVPKPVTISMTV